MTTSTPTAVFHWAAADESGHRERHSGADPGQCRFCCPRPDDQDQT